MRGGTIAALMLVLLSSLEQPLTEPKNKLSQGRVLGSTGVGLPAEVPAYIE